MSKIICDVCGTAYQETAEFCPICGYARSEFLVQDQEDFLADSPLQNRNQSINGDKPQIEPEIYSDAQQDLSQYDDDFEDDFEEELDNKRNVAPSTVVIILLVIIITLLLLAIGVLFFGFFLPNRQSAVPSAPESSVVQTEVTEAPETETTEPTIPCTSLVLTSGITELTKEGQYWLLHVTVAPEDTTDQLVFVSEDESVVTVNEHGRLTAVGEGETIVHISCGEKNIKCKVIVRFQEEAEPEETEAQLTPNAIDHETLPEGIASETESTEQSEPEDATEPAQEEETTEPPQETTANGDVVLKLEKYDVSSTVRGVSFELKLACDLKPEDVKWLTMDSKVAIVKNGLVTTIGPGQTRIVVQYKGQQAECIIRCNF